MQEKIDRYLTVIDEVIQKGPFHDDWQSLSHYEVPAWFRDAKLGLFVHWGLLSVQEYGSGWYGREMYIKDSPTYRHHVATYGDPKTFGYKDFIPRFTAEKFDAEEWASLLAASGARYVVPVAEHHDGFQMYQSDLSPWCAANMGPCKDTLGLLKTELAKKGLLLGASSHRAEHFWFHSGSLHFDSGVPAHPPRDDLFWPNCPAGPETGDGSWMQHFDAYPVTEEFATDWLVRTCELVDRYRTACVYFDWWIENSALRPYLRRFAAYYYNRAHEWGTGAVIQYKFDAFPYGTAVYDIERGQMDHIARLPWQCDTSMRLNSWIYSKDDDYKTPQEILCDFVDIISKNGCLLLNVGPRADGSIPQEEQAILTEIGAWMAQNAEAVYGTTPWKIFGEGPTQVPAGSFTDGIRQPYTPEDIRFTYKNGSLYAFVMRLPEKGPVCIRSLGRYAPTFRTAVTGVRALGFDTPVPFEQTEQGLFLHTEGLSSPHPVCFCVDYL